MPALTGEECSPTCNRSGDRRQFYYRAIARCICIKRSRDRGAHAVGRHAVVCPGVASPHRADPDVGLRACKRDAWHVLRDIVPRLTHNLLTVSVQVFDPLDCRWRVRIHLVVKSILFSDQRNLYSQTFNICQSAWVPHLAREQEGVLTLGNCCLGGGDLHNRSVCNLIVKQGFWWDLQTDLGLWSN